MSAKTYVLLKCDGGDKATPGSVVFCTTSFTGNMGETTSRVRVHAKSEGWTISAVGDYCPDHAWIAEFQNNSVDFLRAADWGQDPQDPAGSILRYPPDNMSPGR